MDRMDRMSEEAVQHPWERARVRWPWGLIATVASPFQVRCKGAHQRLAAAHEPRRTSPHIRHFIHTRPHQKCRHAIRTFERRDPLRLRDGHTTFKQL